MDDPEETPPSALDPERGSVPLNRAAPAPLARADFEGSMPGGNAWYAASVVDSFTFSFGADDGSPADPRRDGFGEGAPVANPL